MARTPTRAAAGRGRPLIQPRRRTSWIAPLAAIGLIVVALGGWLWLRRDGATAALRSIAQLETQDFHALAWSPGEPNTVFFGHHNGLLKSTDGGRTWRPTALEGADAMSLAVSPKAPGRMYAAGHGVFLRSDDGGATWTAPPVSVQGADLHGFAQNPANPDQLYTLDVGQGLLASTDGGSTWKVISATPPGQALAFSADGKTLLVGAATGVQQSTDGGTTWTPSDRGLPGGAQVIALASAADGSIFAATSKGLYHQITTNGDWTATGLNVPILAVAASPLQLKVVLAVDQQGRVYRSEDGGATW